MTDLGDIPKMELPDKLYFKIGEVSRIVGVPPYVLRFWETEFKHIHPKRTESGQRHYRKKDIEQLLTVKYLLYEEKLTIEGARKYLRSRRSHRPATPRAEASALREIRDELIHIRNLLK